MEENKLKGGKAIEPADTPAEISLEELTPVLTRRLRAGGLEKPDFRAGQINTLSSCRSRDVGAIKDR